MFNNINIWASLQVYAVSICSKKTRKGVTSKRHKSHVGKVKGNLGLPKNTHVLFTRETTHSSTSTANYFVWIGKGAFSMY